MMCDVTGDVVGGMGERGDDCDQDTPCGQEDRSRTSGLSRASIGTGSALGLPTPYSNATTHQARRSCSSVLVWMPWSAHCGQSV